MDTATNRKDPKTNSEEDDEWTIGIGRNRVLKFSCDAVSRSNESLPAEKLHMTFRTVQAENKLLNALLLAHGFREVCTVFFF